LVSLKIPQKKYKIIRSESKGNEDDDVGMIRYKNTIFKMFYNTNDINELSKVVDVTVN
jgi:hypothetical protein